MITLFMWLNIYLKNRYIYKKKKMQSKKKKKSEVLSAQTAYRKVLRRLLVLPVFIWNSLSQDYDFPISLSNEIQTRVSEIPAL